MTRLVVVWLVGWSVRRLTEHSQTNQKLHVVLFSCDKVLLVCIEKLHPLGEKECPSLGTNFLFDSLMNS
jgi:hypothetical protein